MQSLTLLTNPDKLSASLKILKGDIITTFTQV